MTVMVTARPRTGTSAVNTMCGDDHDVACLFTSADKKKYSAYKDSA